MSLSRFFALLGILAIVPLARPCPKFLRKPVPSLEERGRSGVYRDADVLATGHIPAQVESVPEPVERTR